MIELYRDRPMEAVHRKSGKIGTVRTLDQSKALCVGEGIDTWTAYFDKYGQPKDDFCPWTVRNIQSCARRTIDSDKQAAVDDAIPIDRALWERVEGLVRGMAESPYESHWYHHHTEARAIVALLPAAPDPDHKAAIELVIAEEVNRTMAQEAAIREGRAGQSKVALALAAIKRGRELEAGR